MAKAKNSSFPSSRQAAVIQSIGAAPAYVAIALKGSEPTPAHIQVSHQEERFSLSN
jgi:hypothetical protein